ncbi:MAG TPA: radical SAM protein [Thermoanaerobaculia bacterium]|nr:radical SAM protein [Thermoanaerobaculia bacterium]
MSDLGWQYLTAADKQQLLAGVRDGKAYGGPYHVEIHPADRCNIDCFFCSTAAIRGTDELPFDRFTNLIDELKTIGTRAIRLSGGGEPLFHRKIKDVLRAVVAAGIPIENLTTNAVLLDEATATLLTQACDQVTISLNTVGAESYATMMKTPARNYQRVLDNIKRLIAIRNANGSKRPIVNIQFLVWRDNYRDIPKMYELARDLGADTMIFSGLAFLTAEQQMTPEQSAEMLALYEQVIRRDEFRHIRNIGSFEQDIQPAVDAMIQRLGAERSARPFVAKLTDFMRREGSLRDKVRHFARMRRNARTDRATQAFADPACVIGWYSMLIRSNGTVAPCCILQNKPLGNVMQTSVREIWNDERFDRYRGELTRIIKQRESWQPSDEQTVESVCAVAGSNLCPMKSFYFARDVEFMRNLAAATR